MPKYGLVVLSAIAVIHLKASFQLKFLRNFCIFSNKVNAFLE